jgi:hypothetical protein
VTESCLLLVKKNKGKLLVKKATQTRGEDEDKSVLEFLYCSLQVAVNVTVNKKTIVTLYT